MSYKGELEMGESIGGCCGGEEHKDGGAHRGSTALVEGCWCAAGCCRGGGKGNWLLLVAAVDEGREADVSVGPCSRLVVARLLTGGARGEEEKKEEGE